MERADDVDVCSFYLENRCRFGDRCRNYHSSPSPPPTTIQSESNEGITVVQKSPKISNSSSRTKTRPKMRTALDVINRICWDKALNAEDFTIVYLDRFTGLISVPLLQFQGNGDDDSAIGDNVPQHRIQQICYKNDNDKIIWEKQTRTDFVFGSTGYSGTITDFIRSLEEEERRAEDVAVIFEEEALVQA